MEVKRDLLVVIDNTAFVEIDGFEIAECTLSAGGF
jgi:hypothetical protein